MGVSTGLQHVFKRLFDWTFVAGFADWHWLGDVIAVDVLLFLCDDRISQKFFLILPHSILVHLLLGQNVDAWQLLKASKVL